MLDHAVMPTDLRCEYLVEPPAVDAPAPLLGWTLADPAGTAPRGWRQAAWQLLVASTPELLTPAGADRWDSGRRPGAATLVAYGGVPLRSREACVWTVRAWDADGAVTPWAAPAHWAMGLLQPDDWQADWIGLAARPGAALARPVAPPDGRRVLWPTHLAARQLRHEFTVRGPLRRATLYVAGLGCHELRLNGAPVGDHVGDPALTNYDHRVCYVAHAVTGQLVVGPNALAVTLGNGRFFAPRWLPPAWPQPRGPNPENWFEEYVTRHWGVPRLRLQLELTYADGSHERVVSGPSWRATTAGPVRANNEYDGETYDARRATPGWDRPGFDDHGWRRAQRLPGPPGALVAQMIEPVRVIETLGPRTIRRPTPGRWVVDVGQVIYGRPRLTVRGPRGATVRIRSAYACWPDGRLRVEDNRAAQNTDRYILAGTGAETWAPAFRGQGFRWLELRAPAGVELMAIAAEALSTDCRPVGRFTCSAPLLVRIWGNVRRGHRAFKRSVPMEPDRDERQGWLGDPAKHAESDGYSFGVAAFYRKWLDDILLEQRPDGDIPEVAPAYWEAYDGDLVWPSVVTILPEWLYDFYGDRRAVERAYPAIVRWLDLAETLRLPDGTWDCNNGDWCDTSTMDVHPERPTGATPRPLIATAYMANNLRIAARFATILDQPTAAEAFRARAAEVAAVFQATFYDRDRGVYGNGTQTSYVLPLAFDLVPADQRERVVRNLADEIVVRHDSHLSVGLIGAQWLMQVLSRIGRADLALRIAGQRTRPGWGYMVEQGATSIWERWDSDTQGPGMNSAALLILAGNLGAWFYQTVAGIELDPAEPGWQRAVLRPRLMGQLAWASAAIETPAGRYASTWRVADGTFAWRVVVPPNATATAWLPTARLETATEGGRPLAVADGVRALSAEADAVSVVLGSGEYRFSASLAPGGG